MSLTEGGAEEIEKQSKNSNGGRGGARPGAGRKPGVVSAAKRELRDLAKEHVPDLLGTLVSIAKESTSDAARVSAIKEIMDRAYGKAPQAITGDDGGPIRSETVIKQVIVDPRDYDA